MVENEAEDKIKVYCPICRQTTNHFVLHSVKRYADANEDYWWCQTFSIVKCCGCDYVGFHLKAMDESQIEYDDDGHELLASTIRIFPHSHNEIEPISTWVIPSEINAVYKETINCYNHHNYRLAGAGMRAIVEAICKDKGIDGKNLEIKINRLTSQGIITKNDRDRLHAIRFIGNDSIHILKNYKPEELRIAIDIIHGILNNLYVIEDKFLGLGVRPVASIDEFLEVLTENLKKTQSGQIDTLRNFLKHDRRIIGADLSAYEQELCLRINNGTFSGLIMCPPPQSGYNQQYKVP